METKISSTVAVAEDCSKFEKKILNEKQEALIQELTVMGFPRSAILEIVENSGDAPKELIVEQLLTSNSGPVDSIPVVEDDGDPLWEDVTVCYKMVIVINTGLKMGLGKTASQAAHAALGLYEVIKERPDLSSDLHTWNEQG